MLYCFIALLRLLFFVALFQNSTSGRLLCLNLMLKLFGVLRLGRRFFGFIYKKKRQMIVVLSNFFMFVYFVDLFQTEAKNGDEPWKKSKKRNCFNRMFPQKQS